jgi:hypothetical protein
LISGDAIVTLKLNSVLDVLLHRQGLSGPPWYTSWSWPVAKESVAALSKLEPNVLAPGHGAHMAGVDTARKLRVFANRFCGRTLT